MTIPELLWQHGLGAVIMYLLITDSLPKIIKAIQWTSAKLAPERMAKLKIQEDEQKRQDELVVEHESFERDLRERDIIAKEQTAKALLLIDSHLQASDKSVQDQLALISTGLITANQSLAVLLDRQARIQRSERKD